LDGLTTFYQLQKLFVFNVFNDVRRVPIAKPDWRWLV